MSIASRWPQTAIALTLILGLLTFAAACSSSSKSASPTPALAPAPTAFPEPTINADTVAAPLKGYTAKLPANFHLRSNFATDAGARFPTDAFFGPKNGNEAQPSIVMTCYALTGAKTLNDYRDEWRQFIGAFSSREIAVAPGTVDSLPAFVFTYKQTIQGQTNDPTPVPHKFEVQKEDYVIIQGNCRWLIALLTPAGQYDTYKPVMDAFIAALKFSARS